MNGQQVVERAPSGDHSIQSTPISGMDSSALGFRLKELRDQRQLSAETLARQCKLSEDHLHQIEAGSLSPSIYTLQQLARVLQVPLVDFFAAEDLAAPAIFTPHDQRTEAICCQAVIQNLGGGYRNSKIEPFMITMPPDATSGGRNLSHHGCEFVFVLSGSILYFVNDIEYPMSAGDSLLFSADRPHRWANNSSESSQILLVLTSDVPSAEMRKGHFVQPE